MATAGGVSQRWLCWEMKFRVWPSLAISSPGDLGRSTNLVALADDPARPEILPACPVLRQGRLHGLWSVVCPSCGHPCSDCAGLWLRAGTWGSATCHRSLRPSRAGAGKAFQSFLSSCLEPPRICKCRHRLSEPSLGLGGRRMQHFPAVRAAPSQP